jgi:hypothetical protein
VIKPTSTTTSSGSAHINGSANVPAPSQSDQVPTHMRFWF